jgi:hypothetical protein
MLLPVLEHREMQGTQAPACSGASPVWRRARSRVEAVTRLFLSGRGAERTLLMWANNLKSIRVALIVSLVGHSAFLVTLFCSTSRHSPLPETIPISVVIVEEENLGSQSQFDSVLGGMPAFEAEGSQTPGVAKLATQTRALQTPRSLISNRNADHKIRPEPKQPSSASDGPAQELRANFWATGKMAAASGMLDLVEQQDPKPPEFTVTRRIDWQANPVEDDKMTYSAPRSSAKLTVREAYSAGLAPAFTGFGANGAGPAFSPGFKMNGGDNSRLLSPNPALLWGSDATARSQRLDWTFVNAKNFGVTAFSYQNEVGRDFQPYGPTKNEFAMAGTSTMKAGGQVRVGPLGFGYATSNIEYADPLANLLPAQQGVTNSSAAQQEASVTLDLPLLLSGTPVSGGVFSQLLPTLWATSSDNHMRTAGQGVRGPNHAERPNCQERADPAGRARLPLRRA